MDRPRIVSQAEWLEARKQLLTKEKESTRQRDALSAERRKLPMARVQKEYVFDGPKGKETLADLFDGRSQLIVYHFMLGPGWEEGCPSCSFLADHIDGALVHLNARDVTLVVVSRAPLPEIAAFKKRMGWRFKWVSSNGNDFNFDYHVSFMKEEMATGRVYYNYEMEEFGSEEAPGASVFYRDAKGEVFHTYSAYARGLDMLVGAYNYLDLVPKGRDEAGLPWTMAWVRHHDRYGVRSPRLRRGGTRMRYMLLIYMDEQLQGETERQQCYEESAQFAHQIKPNYLAAAPLHPTSTATSVKVRDGKSLVTDGPFAETREQLGGYFLIEAKDLDEALGIAARIPAARWGTVEVRPVIEIAGLPA